MKFLGKEQIIPYRTDEIIDGTTKVDCKTGNRTLPTKKGFKRCWKPKPLPQTPESLFQENDQEAGRRNLALE